MDEDTINPAMSSIPVPTVLEYPPSEKATLLLIIDYLDDLSKSPKQMLEISDMNTKENYAKKACDLLKLALFQSEPSPVSGAPSTEEVNRTFTNANRFYRLNGLAGRYGNEDDTAQMDEQDYVDKHVSLAEAVHVGMKTLGARTREDAEQEIEKQPLFKEFLNAVKSRGYFHEHNESYQKKYSKVITKFRLKLRDKAITDPNSSPLSHGPIIRGISSASSRIKLRSSFSKQDQNLLEQAESHKNEGNVKMQSKDYQAAVVSYSFAIDIISQISNSSHRDVKINKSVYLCNRSAAYLSLSQFGLAGDDAKASLSHNNIYGKALFRLGLSYYFQEKYEDALECFMDAKNLGEDNASTNQYIKKTIEIVKGPEIPSPRQSPKKSDILKIQGNNCMAQKMYDKAIDYYTRAIDVARDDDPNMYVYYSNRAAALCFLQDYQQASEDAAIAIELKPDYGKAYARYGLSLFFLGRYEEAKDAYETALEYEPNNKASLSYLKKAKEKLEEAMY